MKTKTCVDCNVEQPVTEFYAVARSKDGYRNDCRTCMAKKRKKFWDTHPEKKIERYYKEKAYKQAVFKEHGLTPTQRLWMRRRSEGKCVRCGESDARPNRAMCQTCMDRESAQQKVMGQRLRMAALEAYGGAKCSCCGESHVEFLALDHINGGGNQMRKVHKTGKEFYKWLRNNGYPEGFRVLCHNCNHSLGSYGYCPHNKDFK